MQFPTFDNFADTPRKKLFWAVVAAVALFQLGAFYMLCSQQVQKAQVREAVWNAQRAAVADCLDYMPKTTVGGCRAHLAAMPLSFGYR